MNKELTSMMELTSFLDLHDGDHLLELTTGHDLIAPILKSLNPNLNYTIDLCQLENVMINCEAIGYYHRIFFMNGLDSLAFEYDTIFISMIFNTFSKEEGLALLNKLVKQMKKNLYFIIEEEFPQNIWTLQDFKDFDLSFFNLGQSQQKLIKIYPSSAVSEVRPLEWSTCHQSLSILYVLPHRNLTGGLKMLYEQMKALQKRGHQISVMIRGNYEKVVPDWVEDFVPDQEFILKPYESYQTYLKDIDVIFAGFYNQVEELKNDRVPVVYWEQGHEYLYGDVKDKTHEAMIRESLKHQFNQDICYATDSNYVHDIVKARFHKESYVLPIFIDTHVYYPKEKEPDDLLTILLVGNPLLAFKGFTKALQVLVNAWSQGLRFKVNWACQVQPQTSPLPFEINYFVNVSQTELARIYRESDILLSCSLYEGCPMPPLEAMASGVAVITTDCGGIHQYAIHQENALIATSNTIFELTAHLKELLTNHELRHQLINNGIQTAKKLNNDHGAELLENILSSSIHQFKEKKNESRKVRVLFMIGTLLGGGAEKVLLNLVKEMDKDIFDITVQTIYHQGIYIDEIKQYATYKTIYKQVASSIEEAEQLKAYYHYLSTLNHEEFSQAVINEVYDIEVAFLEDHSTRIIAYSPNKQAKKVAWVHTDLIKHTGADLCFKDFEEHKGCYEKFDQIVCVSEGAKEAFVEKFGIKDNVFVRYNPINEIEIQEKANQAYLGDLGEEFKIVSVGRLAQEKGYDRLLMIQKKLKELGLKCRLIIVGEGQKRNELEALINEHELNACVTLVGYTDNPYQIVKQCQLFVCSSYVEGLSSAVIEALILGLPVVATDCGGNKELLENGKSGILVHNDMQSLFNGIYYVLSNTVMYFELTMRAKQRGKNFCYKKQVEAIQSLLLS